MQGAIRSRRYDDKQRIARVRAFGVSVSGRLRKRWLAGIEGAEE